MNKQTKTQQKLKFFIVCVIVSISTQECAGAHRGQEMVLDPLVVELEMFVSYSMWMLGSELQSTRLSKKLSEPILQPPFESL